MKIENNGKVQVLDHLVKSANAKSPKQAAVSQKDNQQVVDKVELSGRKDEIEKLKEKVKAAPCNETGENRCNQAGHREWDLQREGRGRSPEHVEKPDFG